MTNIQRCQLATSPDIKAKIVNMYIYYVEHSDTTQVLFNKTL